MKKILIKPYKEQYFSALEEIHDSARKIELDLAGLSEAFVPLKEAAVKEGLFDYHVDVALVDDAPVGFVAYSEEELAWLYVAPKQMKQGIGSRLVEHALVQMPSIHSIEVLVGNEPARRLYEKMNFQVMETLSGAMPGNEAFQVTVYCMERRI